MFGADERTNDAAAAFTHSDHELVKGSREGDAAAWSLLIDKYKNLIYSIPIRHGFNREDASDIFQDVCVELLGEVSRIRDPQALPKWLMTVTSHKCFQRWKRQSRFVSVELDESSEPEFQLPPDALRIVCQAEQEQRLREALGRLAGRCRQLIEMLFFEETPRPYGEIAQSLGIATGSIGFIRQRCLRRLRDRIHDIGQIESTEVVSPGANR